MPYTYNSIMLIDDSPIDNLIAEILIRENYLAKNIITHTSALKALNYLAEFNNAKASVTGLPELILLDLYLPVMDGFDFLSKFHQLSFPVMPRVYVLSSALYPSDRERANAYECVKGFMLKPLSSEGLKQLMI